MTRVIKFRGPIQSEGADLGAQSVGTLEIEDGSVLAADLATDAVETAKIKNANVTLPKLAAGITPSHVVKFAGSSASENDADASVVVTVTGALATDVAHVTLRASTVAVYVTKAVVSADTLTVTLSGNGGAGTVVDYTILRAAA